MDAVAEKSESKNLTKMERRSDFDLVLTRTFNGPARIVFEAWTKPELLKRWWAPTSFGVTLFECEVDLRVGGKCRQVFGRDRKDAMTFSGEFLEVNAPTRLVVSQVFEPMRHLGAVIVTTTFDERDGKTLVTLHQHFPSKESLDGAVASGMEKGMLVTMDQLESLVGGLRSTSH